jgi:5-methylcytosine-specific restriction endonuclease McrA
VQFFHSSKVSGKDYFNSRCRVCRTLHRENGVRGRFRFMTEKWLRQKYEVEQLTTYDIADLVQCSITPIRLRLLRYGIEYRERGPIPRNPEDPASKRAKVNQYRYHNTPKGRARQKVRLARVRALDIGAPGSCTIEDVFEQYRKQDGKCYWGGAELKEDYHMDHYIPLAQGGSNDPENIVLSCPYHNLSKGGKLPREFLSEDVDQCR